MSQQLRRLWEQYLQVPLEPASRGVKTEKLDAFLEWALYEATRSEGNILPEFSDMHSVSNLLAGEFLADIHQICSHCEDEDVTQLQSYLQVGRGGVILRVLHTIGVQGLSCSQELAELMVSILPLSVNLQASSQETGLDIELCDIGNCYNDSRSILGISVPKTSTTLYPAGYTSAKKSSHKFPLLSASRGISGHTEAHPTLNESAFQRNIHYQRSHRHSSSQSKDADSSTSNSDEEYVHTKSPFHFRVTSYPLMRSKATCPLGIFPGLLGDVSEPKKGTDGEMHPNWTKMEPLNLCLLLLSLVRELCHEDCYQLESKKSVSVHILPSLTQLFSSMYYDADLKSNSGSEGRQTMHSNDLNLLKRYFVRVVLSISSYVAMQISGLTVLHANNTLPVLLSVAVDIIYKQRILQNDACPDTNKLHLAQDVATGIWLLLEHIFSALPLNPSVLNASLKLFHDVISHRGLAIIEGLVILWEHVMIHEEEHKQLLSAGLKVSEAKQQLTHIITVMSRVIRFLKQSKINYIHSVKCSRQKHKKCDFRWYAHHHHDVLGLPGSKPFILSSENCDSMEALNSDQENTDLDLCAVACIGEFLLYLYKKCLSRVVQVKLLCCIEDAGVCCCMSPGSIIHVLVKNISGQSPTLRDYTLKILVRILLDQCGGAEQVQRSKGICHICKDETMRRTESEITSMQHFDNREVAFVSHQETSDSAFSGSDVSLHDDGSQEHRIPRWHVLKEFQSLVLDPRSDPEIGVQVMQHLLTLVSQGCGSLEQELFQYIFMPLLASTKTLTNATLSEVRMDQSDESSMPSIPIIQHCLVGLPLLLQSKTVHTIFLNHGGMQLLCDLSQVNVLRTSVLRMFQVLIILEERKKAEASSASEHKLQLRHSCEDNMDTIKADHTKSSENMTPVDCAEEATEAMSSCKMVHHQVCSLDKADTARAFQLDENHSFSSILDEFTIMLSESVRLLADMITKDSLNVVDLGKVVDIWNTCDQLFAQSSGFRHRFLSLDGPSYALEVYHTALDELVKCTDITLGAQDLRGQGCNSLFSTWLALVQYSLNVCLAACSLKSRHTLEQFNVTDLLEHTKHVLSSSHLWTPEYATGVKHVCDMLLATAVIKYSHMDIVQLQMFALMQYKEEESIYDKELLDIQEPGSSKESETCFTEQGYEADSEFASDDNKDFYGRHGSQEASSRVCSSDHVTYPEICRLVIELLALYNEKSHNKNCSAGVLPPVLLKMLSLIRHNVYSAMSLYNQGILKVLLEGFRPILISSSDATQAEQKLILDVFLSVARHAISSDELRTFLELFKADGVSLDNLLPTALSLIQSYRTQPSHIICFPITISEYINQYHLLCQSLASNMLNTSVNPVLPMTENGQRDSLTFNSTSSQGTDGLLSDKIDSLTSDEDVSKSNMRTNNHHAPLQFCLKDQVIWPSPNSHKGFSMSMWLRMEASDLQNVNNGDWMSRETMTESRGLWDILNGSSKRRPLPDRLRMAMKRHFDSRHWSNQCLHLVSVGNSTLMFEVWADPRIANLIFRIVTHVNGHQKVLCEVPHVTSIKPSRWHHMTLAFREEPYSHTKRVTVSTILDGCFQHESVMEYSTQEVQDTECTVYLGHVLSQDEVEMISGRWQLGNFMLFKDSQMTKHTSFHIYALGPQCCTLSQCDCSEQTLSYAPFITDDVVKHSGLSLDVLTGNHTIYLQHLRENLVVGYNPRIATAFSLYSPPPDRSQAPSSGLKGFLLPSSSHKSTFNSLMHQPIAVQVKLVTDVAPQIHQSLTQALNEIGGLSVFICLFAKIVEVGANPLHQAEALKLLFALLHNNPKYVKEFHDMGGHDLLNKVFATTPCHIGPQIIKVLLDVCLSKTILVYSQSGQRYQLDGSTDALIQDTQVIMDLLLAWKIWEKAEDGVWILVFEALELLIRPEHPHRNFNIQQLQNANLTEKMLMICLERLQDSYPALPVSICCRMVTIIHHLVSSPPDIHNVMSICDFLLLTHPAASTFVCHGDEDFYFRHKWVHQSSIIQVSTETQDMQAKPVQCLQNNTKSSSPDPEPGKIVTEPPAVIQKCDNTDLELPERNPEPTSTSTPFKKHPKPRTKFSSKQFFRVNKLFSEDKEEGVKCHSLPSHGFWSRYDEEYSVSVVHEDVDINVSRKLQKGISTMFKTLTSSYPESLKWDRVTNFTALVQQPEEIDVKEFKVHREGTELTDLAENDTDLTVSSKKGSRLSQKIVRGGHQLKLKLKQRIRSYSDNVTHSMTRQVRRSHDATSSGETDEELLESASSDASSADQSLDDSPEQELFSSVMAQDVPLSSSDSEEPDAEQPDCSYARLRDYIDDSVAGGVALIPDENDNDNSATCRMSGKSESSERSSERPANSNHDTRLASHSDSFVMVDDVHLSEGDAIRKERTPSSDWQVYSLERQKSQNLSQVSIGYHRDELIEQGEEGLVFICSHLLEILSQILVNMPQDDFLRVTAAVLKPQILIVMAHHNSPHIRVGVIKVLDVCLLRMTKDQEQSFMDLPGFSLLACQLHQHEVTTEIAEACFTLLLGQPHKLDDNLSQNMLVEMRPIQEASITLLISLLENSIMDTVLCHNLLCLMGQIFSSVPNMVLPMLSNGLTEALCNMFSGLCALPPRATDIGGDERLLLIEGIQKFFCCIADKCFSMRESGHFQHLEYLFTALYALENKLIEIYGVNSDQVGHLTLAQSMSFRIIFDYVSELMESQSGLLSRSLFTGAVGSLLSKLPLASTNSFSEEDEWNSLDEGLNTANQNSFGWPSLASSNLLCPSEKKNGTSLRSRSLPGTNRDNNIQHKSFTFDQIQRPKVQSSLDLFTTGLFSGKKNQGLTQAELAERLKKVIVMATDFLLYTVHHHDDNCRGSSTSKSDSDPENVYPEFSCFLLDFMMKGIITGLERSLFQRKSPGVSVLWQVKDTLRMQFARLLERMLLPDQDVSLALHAIELLATEPKFKDVLKITYTVKLLGIKMSVYLYQLQQKHIHQLSTGQRDQIQEINDVLHSLGVQVYKIGRRLMPNEKANMEEDKALWNLQFDRERSEWKRIIDEAMNKILKKQQQLAQKLVAQALQVTQGVSNTQNIQRKKFLEHVKKQISNKVHIKKAWQQLIQQLTHERAVWYDAKSHPKCWQLDPTEGPCRVRRRMQRCHLGIDKKFLTPENQYKLKAEQFDPPLAYLFDEDGITSDSAALIYKLHTSQNILYTCTCTHVTPASESTGELLIGQSDLYFISDEAIKDANYTQVLLGNKDLFISLAQLDVKGLQKRWFQLCDNALEIFLTNGKTCLLAFRTTQERDDLYTKLLTLELPNLITDENLSAIQHLWLDGKMTNFEYLTHLNKMAGRSFNDLMQYPVFPFILANYDQAVLDLELESSYRNLSRPIAVQHKHREQRYIDNYMCLAGEQHQDVSNYHSEPYHYGSHYSNSGTVLHFLVRLPPFTQMFLDYQDNSFDLPDRTFHSLATSWKLASLESSTDVKELIPEFFFLPEFLCNAEGYNFGNCQNGVQVWDVTLPPWCMNDPRLFILIHRQALESAYVTQRLAAWIDLVFGFKQTGKAAVDAINVFHPATYFGVDVDSIEDLVRRKAVKTMIKTYGQTPKQLFNVPHPTIQGTGFQGMKGFEKQAMSHKESPLIKSPLKTVRGLVWGNYVGSPDQGDPVMVWIQSHPSAISLLVALPTGGMFGLGANSCLLVMYSKEKGATSINTVDVLWAAIISWAHPDSIIRIKNRKDLPAVNFVHWNTEEQVTCCASVPDCRLLFFGGTSGVITILNTKFNQNKQSHLQVFGQKSCLYGHSAAVTMICVCVAFSVVVSASRDKTVIIWDLNRLCYVRSIRDHQHSVYTIAVSDTLGDIASVSHTDHGSCLMLHTINAQHVRSIECEELILCLTFSVAPEGQSINVIAGGLNNGTIRLWSSWDLTPVRDICSNKFTHPVISLAFTYDCQRLFAANADGTVAVWEKPSSNRPRDVMFIPFL